MLLSVRRVQEAELSLEQHWDLCSELTVPCFSAWLECVSEELGAQASFLPSPKQCILIIAVHNACFFSEISGIQSLNACSEHSILTLKKPSTCGFPPGRKRERLESPRRNKGESEHRHAAVHPGSRTNSSVLVCHLCQSSWTELHSGGRSCCCLCRHPRLQTSG